MDEQVIAVFKSGCVTCVDDLKRSGLPYTFAGSGSAREVYKVGNVAVKFERAGGAQTASEIAALKLIATDPRFADLQEHVMPLYYADEKHGILITKFYERKSTPDDEKDPDRKRVEGKLIQGGIDDLFWANFAKDGDKWIAIDLGWSQQLLSRSQL